MSNQKDGGPAFPRTGYLDTSSGTLPDGDEVIRHQDGMTLRDYFAAKAMQGMMCNGFMPNQASQSSDEMFNYAIAAFKLSDAMLEARKQ